MQERSTAAGMTAAQKLRPYAAAVLLTVAVLLMRLGLTPWVEDRPVFIIYLIPIVLSAYLGGLWPGLFATVLVAVATDWFVLPPQGSLRIDNPLYLAQWLFMVLEGALISVLFAELERWRRGTRHEAAQRKHAATELKVRVGFAAALAFLGTIGIVSYLSVVRLDANSRLVAHSHEVMANIDALRATATESEAASRAFLISGNEQFAAEYTRATGRIDGLLQQLADAVRDDPVQSADVPVLGDAIRARITRSDQVMQLRRSAGMPAVQENAARGYPGAVLQARVREIAQRMKTHELELLARREAQTRRSSALTQAVIVGGSMLALVVLGLALFAIRRDFAGRERAERELKDARDQLELRVEQRTAELAAANETLHQSERRFRALLEHGADSIALVDAQNKILYLSPAVSAVEGYTPEELVGRAGPENTHPDDLPRLAGYVDKLLANPGKPIPVLWRRRHKDGRWLWLEGVATNLLGDPAVGAIVTNYRDVSERMQAETRMREQLQRLALLSRVTRAIGERQDLRSIFQVVVRTIEDELPVDFCLVCLYDIGENRLTVSCIGARSADAAAALALDENSLVPIDENGLGRCVRGDLVYEPDIASSRFEFPARLARAGYRSVVFAPLVVESQVFGVALCARRKPEAFSSGECEFLRQASEHTALAAHQAQLYGALQQAYDDLRMTQQQVMQQERLRALGQMASGIAHDINNAISPMALYTEALLEREPNLTERGRKQLEIVQRAVDDVAQTVARMGEFYRMREPQVSLVPVDLNLLVEQVVDLTRARWSDMAQQRGAAIDLRRELDDKLPKIAAVESQIRDALVNLVFNAVDAMPSGGPLTIRTRMDDGGRGKIVVLEVADRGIGMDEETKRRCLEPFFTTKGERGTGLGLAMVYGVAQRHGASLEIDSERGRGTVVRLSFAVAPPPNAEVTGSRRAPSEPLRILIVDDDPLLLNSLRDVLESDGHHVTAANGGQAGINAFVEARAEGNPFPVVITDLGMPHVDGRKVAATIKASVPATRILMLTGWGRRLVAEGDVPPGVDQVLSKPPKLVELRAALAEN